MPGPELHYNGNGESTIVAMYDPTGKLIKCGTPAEVQAAAIVLMQMKQVFDNSFLLGGDSVEDAAQTLAQVQQYKQGLAQAEATTLRAQAAELVARAEALEGGE